MKMNFFSRNTFISMLLLSSLSGCSSFKDITDPMKEEGDDQKKESASEVENVTIKKVNLYFVRPADALTAMQDVELYVNDNEIGELEYKSKIQTSIKPGNYELVTKEGWAIGLPVLGGACKFSKDFNLTKENYYFKIDFDVGLLCGEHEIIEITESEYLKLESAVD